MSASCDKCGHPHTPTLGGICIGCGCTERPTGQAQSTPGPDGTLTCQWPPCTKTITGRGDTSHVEVKARALGWTAWSGETMGGTWQHVTFCPDHKDLKDDPDGLPPIGWDAECGTCNHKASRGMTEDRASLLTREQAETWAEDHYCEPDTYVIEPAKEHVG